MTTPMKSNAAGAAQRVTVLFSPLPSIDRMRSRKRLSLKILLFAAGSWSGDGVGDACVGDAASAG